MSQSTKHRGIITATVVLLAAMELLDSTIVNVSLPNMMGSLGANIEQISWVLTSYIVAASIMMPLTGLLIKNLGQKRFMIIGCVVFLVASMCCGLTTSVSQIVFFRVIQGLCGAGFVPLSQVILQNIYSKEEQAKAMAIWGCGIMVAPILGPTLGGYITEYMNWRWVFYINVPVCIVCLLLVLAYIPETERTKQPIDWRGLIIMALGVGCLQTFLDQGNQKDWFNSNMIIILAIISVIALTRFIIRGLLVKRNIVNLKMFKNKNYSLCSLMFMIFVGAVMGPIAILPLMLQHLMGYPTVLNGLVLVPSGIASAISMITAPIFMKRFGNKTVMLLGIGLSLYGIYMMSQFNLYISVSNVVWPGVVRGLGMGLFIVPLSVEATATLTDTELAEASGFFNFWRMLGNAVGISLLTTVLTRETQINWNRLGGHLTMFNQQHLTQVGAQNLANELSRQASMVAFINCYWIDALAFLILIPMVLLLTKSKPNRGEVYVAH